MRLWLPRRPALVLSVGVLLSAALFAQPAKSVSDLLAGTFLEYPQELVPYRARQDVRGPSPMTWLNAPYADLSVKRAGGGIISTVSDLLRFDMALNAGRLLRQDTQDRMYTSARLDSGAMTGYGLGWIVTQEGGRLKVSHSGGAMGLF